MNNIYISYAWKDNKSALGQSREALVDRICDKLNELGYKIVRDKATLTLGDSIREFMHEIGKGNYVIVVLSDKYLRSEYCMFEAVEIIRSKGYEQRVFPIVLSDADIYSHDGQFAYVEHWRQQKRKIQEMVDGILDREDDFALMGVAKKIYEIADGIDDFVNFISDKLSINPETNFDGFIESMTQVIRRDNVATRAHRSILVAGTGAFTLPDEILWVSQSLGRRIAEQGYKLITGGWQGVDYVVSEAFAQVVMAQGQRLSDRLTQVVPTGQQPQFKGGSIRHVPPGPTEWLESLKAADLVILIGGQGGTFETYQYAAQENLPVLPIVCTNGDAKAVFDHMLENWASQDLGKISQELFKSLNQYINDSKTADGVCQDVLAIADEVIFAREVLRP